MSELLTKEELTQRVEDFQNFQNHWTLEKIKNMTLDEYTKLGSRDTFTYNMEWKLKFVPMGGGNSFKFGIYQYRNNPTIKYWGINNTYYETKTDEKYAWISYYGETANEAFEKIKKIIISIIEFAQNGQINKIEEIQDFMHNYKWKIAFYFQNPNNPLVFGIVADYALQSIAQNQLGKANLKTSEIYSQIFSKEGKPSSIEDLFQFTRKMWLVYSNEDEYQTIYNKIGQSTNEMQNLSSPNNINQSLNQILYGPPGTGKTYHTINKALEIISQEDQSIDEDLREEILEILENLKSDSPTSENRKRAKEIFDDFKNKKQIEFITFHQSYGYEEFVEGIKPIPTEDSENVKYEIKNGVFKTICSNAGYIQEKLDDVLFDTKSRVWKISLGGKNWKDKTQELQNYCFENNEIRIGWEDASVNNEAFKELGNQQKSSVLQFKYEMQIGDLVCVLDSVETIKAIGIIESDFYFDKDSQFAKKLSDFYSARKVKWIDRSIRNILLLNKGTELTLKTVYPLKEISPIDLLSLLQDKRSKTTVDNTQKPHILVIDEINRGNISKIFGELITLIESSKRIGADEELRVTLPYSQESFGVPSNLYIIGTMNTADKSITSIDTALRRRFEFEEMMPDPSKLKKIKIKKEDEEGETEINLEKMLKAINERIEYLCGREKTIGHAYLIKVNSLQSLKNAFQNKIIPLLQEYFYNDYEAINAVLNDNGMIRNNQDFKYTQGSFRTFTDNRGMNEKKIFRIATENDKNEGSNKCVWNDPNTYKKIYGEEDTKQEDTPNNQDSKEQA